MSFMGNAGSKDVLGSEGWMQGLSVYGIRLCILMNLLNIFNKYNGTYYSRLHFAFVYTNLNKF